MSNAIYTKPWMRASPYLIGMLAGMAWVRYKPSLCALADRATRLTDVRCVVCATALLRVATAPASSLLGCFTFT